MKFFIPAAQDEEQTERVYQAVKKFMVEQGNSISDARIREISFWHNGKKVTEIVGEPSPTNGETVVAIFDAKNLYLVCTFNRGVACGEPMLAGKHHLIQVEPFDAPV